MFEFAANDSVECTRCAAATSVSRSHLAPFGQAKLHRVLPKYGPRFFFTFDVFDVLCLKKIINDKSGTLQNMKMVSNSNEIKILNFLH